MSLTFQVHGIPAPQGSKRHVGNGVMIESSKKVKPWREAVKWAALGAVAEQHGVNYAFAPNSEPVRVHVTFHMPRPKSHFRTGKNAHLLRDAAPRHPSGKPDLDKLLRSTLDAIGEAGVWRDDSQVVEVVAVKGYANSLTTPGASVRVIGL